MTTPNPVNHSVISLSAVSKRYGNDAVVSDVDFSIQAGECVVLVGHNGAGKTTLMKLMLGLTRPSSGRVNVLGGDPASGELCRSFITIIDFQPLPAGDCETARIEAELLHDGSVNIGDIVAILNGVEAEFVGGSVDSSAFDSASCHPDGKAEVVVTSPVRTLAAGSASEFRAPDHERFVEEASLLEIFQEARDGLIDLPAILGVICFQVAVSIPSPCSATAMVNLHKPHAAFDQSPRGQAQPPE